MKKKIVNMLKKELIFLFCQVVVKAKKNQVYYKVMDIQYMTQIQL